MTGQRSGTAVEGGDGPKGHWTGVAGGPRVGWTAHPPSDSGERISPSLTNQCPLQVPPGTPGPRYRSYADAVGQPARRWFRPHYGEQDDRIQSPREPARKRTVATMTGEAEDQPLQPTDWHQPPLTSPPPSPPCPPRGQRHGRRTRGTVVTEDSFLQDEPEQQDEVRVMEEPPHTPTHSELEAPFDELQAEEEAAAAITSTPQSSVEVTVQKE
ncbi:hypothetical protein D9C73_000167 [Collichthys lucidus]|uniref:Uncharacterized protein n=1 Tax=Collichthys lucidus TaxID=240159 RepID=A0A4U5TYW6_COLLU|nr:hypothetical protein D9C73_000167 [Collichthys lucidus]